MGSLGQFRVMTSILISCFHGYRPRCHYEGLNLCRGIYLCARQGTIYLSSYNGRRSGNIVECLGLLLALTLLLSSNQIPAQAAQASAQDNQTGTEAVMGGHPAQSLSVFDTLQQAQEHGDKLRAQGLDVAIREDTDTIQLDNLRLGVYRDLEQLDKDMKRLEQHGIENQLLGSSDKGKFAISVGVFSVAANVQRMKNRLTELGFNNIRIIPLSVEQTRYIVEIKSTPESSTSSQQDTGGHGTGGEPEVTVLALPDDGAARRQQDNDIVVNWGVDTLRAEGGFIANTGQPVETTHYVHAGASAQLLIRRRWEARLAGRVDGYYQQGTPDADDTDVDYGESYIRYHDGSRRITVGTQAVAWGRADEIPPNDRLTPHDLTRFVLDELPDRRRAVPAFRIEQFVDAFKADLLWVPFFREAELPDKDSIWSPVDKQRGRIITVERTPVFRQLVQQGSFGEDSNGANGVGLRLSHTATAFDIAFTLQRGRHPIPYYRLDPRVRASLLNGNNVATALTAAKPTFTEVYPWSWFAGADMGMNALEVTWRLEAAFISHVPVTTKDFLYTTERGIEWVAGAEFFPGDADTRVNLQVAGRNLLDNPGVLDRYDVYTINGEIERPFLRNRWRGDVRFSVGLDDKDMFLNPRLAYTGWEPHEFYLSAFFFAGDEATPGGFHNNHDLITLGWQAEY